MDIRINTPSFGMAFRTPAKEEMAVFTKYLTDDFKVPTRLAKRGLSKIVDKHAKDKHFEIFFNAPNQISAEPISSMAKEMNRSGQLVQKSVKPNIFARYNAKYSSNEYKEAYASAGIVGQLLMDLGRIADALVTHITAELKPQEVLPNRLRKASANVSDWETALNRQIKEQKNIEKGIGDISSIFEPKSRRWKFIEILDQKLKGKF